MGESVSPSAHPARSVSPGPRLPVSRGLLLEVTPCIPACFLFEHLYPPPQTQPESLCLLRVFCLLFQLHCSSLYMLIHAQASSSSRRPLTIARKQPEVVNGHRGAAAGAGGGALCAVRRPACCCPLPTGFPASPVACAEKGAASLRPLVYFSRVLSSFASEARVRVLMGTFLPAFPIRPVTVFKEHLSSGCNRASHFIRLELLPPRGRAQSVHRSQG